MNRVTRAFRNAHDQGRTALMPYITAGDPPVPELSELIRALDEAGADVIEIGIPFSDPIADGPVIASAMHRALERGFTPKKVFEQIRASREGVAAALVAMVSVSIVTHLGIDAFVDLSRDSGLDGLIVPDADLDDFGPLAEACERSSLVLIPLIAPTTSTERQQVVASEGSGFLYLLARAGVTGERADAPEVSERITALRKLTDLPIGVGFGISTADHVRAVGEHADGAIIGSALVRALDQAHRDGQDVAAVASAFVRSLQD